MTLKKLNTLSKIAAKAAFTRCCGSSKWADAMVDGRPFKRKVALFASSDAIWKTCEEADFLEAFEHHPKIGDVKSLTEKFASTAAWAGDEQGSMQEANATTIQRLAEGNERYEEKFGFIFIVCATGKSAAEMLALLEGRLPNVRVKELQIASEEQHKITKIRLEKLLA